MTELSPSAQAVLDAFRAVPDLRDCPSIAAAIRAAADQVVPDDPQEAMHFTTEAIRLNRQCTRHQLLAIADGLKAHQ